ncbi:MAG: ATP-dependent helicase RecQ [Anaerolineales bacterium]|nr:ATP-dependent helicase RecQ [Anaerolineales bacterium]
MAAQPAHPMEPHDALWRYFNFPAFRPGQEVALRHLLGGRDALVVMPTGSGKSLIYQLAALLLPDITLVISPLVALMKDQIDGLTRRGIAATFVNSSLDTSEQSRRLRGLAEGQYRIILVAPERLRSRAFREALARVSLSLFAVDEAHCLSQWGHDFRPDYLHLADARREFKAPVTLALTATATPRVQDDIIRLLGLARAERLVTGFNRPNLTFEVFSTPDVNAKLNLVRDFLADAEGASRNAGGIIYTGTRRDAEEVAEFVREVCGLDARHYHGALDPVTRTRTQDAFLAGDLPVVVATNAFGMGIDRPDVRFVLHHTLPGTLEAYYQEAGRAGRDGLPARAVLLYSPKDTALHEFFIENDSPTAAELRAVHTFLGGPVSGMGVTLEELERATGLPRTKARVALEQLEIARALHRSPDEAYGVIRAEALPLSEAALQTVARQVAARREHKRSQLEKIVDYAETNACRRRAILHHFGDTSPCEAPLCCDNCLARAEAAEAQTEIRPAHAQTQSERAALIVLDTIAKLKWEIGKGKLAQILKGSSGKDVARYARARNYGKFAALRVSEVESLIGQLIDAGHVKQVGSKLPTLKLTPKGENALEARAAIRVDLRPVQPGAAQKLTAQREAGGTVALTGQMLARGLTPEQIAAARGLTVGTITSHLAQLIAEGRADVNAVVPAEVQQQIRAVIAKVGSVGYLAPIKALLPAEIDYNVIRCVVEAWRREQGAVPTGAVDTPAGKERAARVHGWGESGSPESIPELIAALNDPDGTVRRLAASALGKLQALAAVEPLLALLECEPGPQVRQYAIKALGRIGDEQARAVLERISTDSAEMEYNRVAAKVALNSLRRQPSPSSSVRPSPLSPAPTLPGPPAPDDPVSAFLSRPHPRPLTGPWLAGWALDFHSRFSGADHDRSEVGELAYLYKYRSERHLARELAARWAELLAAHPELPRPDAVIPIPPSLVKTRTTKPQKEMTALAQKQANVAGAFALKGDMRGKRLILVDDLYDSGATLAEAARVLARAGVASLVVLTLTKTIHADA